MTSFTTLTGRKYAAGTVGQTQRGHIQDAYRPDYIWLEDIEDRESIRSMLVTQGIIDKISEAMDGLSVDGSYYVTCNYISDQGVVQWLMNKSSLQKRITPMLANPEDNSSAYWSIHTKEIVDKLRADSEDWWGEYQCNPMRSENRFFDVDRLEKDMLACLPHKRESAGVKYWADYLPHHRYGQGSDHSEGIGQDSNTLVGFDFTTGEQIYSYANNMIAPDLAAHEFARVGAEYGNCIYAPEVNNLCGGTVRAVLKQLNYPSLYRYTRNQDVKDKVTERVGWETNSSTKYNMYYEYRKDYNDGLIKINDINILKEMKAYTNSDLNEEKAGLITRHFDLLTATIIAWQMRKHSVVAQTNTLKSYSNKYDHYLESLKT